MLFIPYFSIACPLNNYLNFSNIDGAHFGPVKLEKNPECIVCSRKQVTIEVERNDVFEDFLEKVKKKYQLSAPDIRASDSFLYMTDSIAPEMEDAWRGNLLKTLAELNLADGDEILVADPSLREAITIKLKFV